MSTTPPDTQRQAEPRRITVEARADGTGTMDLGGVTSTVTADSMDQARRQLLHLVAGHARSTGHAVTVLARDPHEEHLLRVAPDGQVEPIEAPGAPEPDPEPAHTAGAAPAVDATTPAAPPRGHQQPSRPSRPPYRRRRERWFPRAASSGQRPGRGPRPAPSSPCTRTPAHRRAGGARSSPD